MSPHSFSESGTSAAQAANPFLVVFLWLVHDQGRTPNPRPRFLYRRPCPHTVQVTRQQGSRFPHLTLWSLSLNVLIYKEGLPIPWEAWWPNKTIHVKTICKQGHTKGRWEVTVAQGLQMDLTLTLQLCRIATDPLQCVLGSEVALGSRGKGVLTDLGRLSPVHAWVRRHVGQILRMLPLCQWVVTRTGTGELWMKRHRF